MIFEIREKLLTLISAATNCEIIPRWRIQRLAQTHYLRRVIHELDIDCFLDVGANCGQYRDYLRNEVNYDGLIVSFEPHPDCVSILRSRIKDDTKWYLNDYALGSTNGTLELNIMVESQYSSFLNPDNTKVAKIDSTNRISNTVQVEVKTLDVVFPALQHFLKFRRPFLKLDTQGFDIQVVVGGENILDQIKCIQTEISNIPIYKGIANISETLEFFSSREWNLAHMFPANPDQFPAVVDFDAYLLRF